MVTQQFQRQDGDRVAFQLNHSHRARFFGSLGLRHLILEVGVAQLVRDYASQLDELNDLSKRRPVPARDIAIIYAGLGDKDQAFKWLRQACKERNGSLVYLKVDPVFKSLRADPRFADLLQCIGLPQ